MDEPEDLTNDITAAVREADQHFERVGGSSRHWVRDCFLPMLEKHGLVIVKETPATEPTALVRTLEPTAMVCQLCKEPTTERSPEGYAFCRSCDHIFTLTSTVTFTQGELKRWIRA